MDNIGTEVNSKISVNLNSKKINFFEISILIYIVLSFSIQFFSHVISSNLLLIFAMLIASFLIFIGARSNYFSFDYKLMKINILWIFAFLMIVLSQTRTQFGSNFLNSLVSLFSFYVGISLLVFSGKNSTNFRLANNAIIFFAKFYAFSIWIQYFDLSIYKSYLKLIPNETAIKISSWARRGFYYTGFSSNPAFTAGHIVCGIFFLMSKMNTSVDNKKRNMNIMCLVFLSFSLLMTGKRAHLLFLIISLTLLSILPFKGKKLIKKMKIILIFFIVVLVIIAIFYNVLLKIPVISRSVDSVLQIIRGEDVSNGRNILYRYAWKLFKENILFGIGWGNFRKLVPSLGLFKVEMETHNVYLQLLCETGIVGFISILIPVLFFLKLTLSSLRIEVQNFKRRSWINLLYYSLGYQIFFLLYGLTGNVFYDPNFLMMYFYCCAITNAYILFKHDLNNTLSLTDENY